MRAAGPLRAALRASCSARRRAPAPSIWKACRATRFLRFREAPRSPILKETRERVNLWPACGKLPGSVLPRANLPMADAIHNAISILLKESSLSENEMHAAVLQMMDGNGPAIGLGLLLTALRLKGETVDEIVGACVALRERAIRIPTSRVGLFDTCGTGEDELRTFNISTATAFVTAACGVPVAKHSNRGFSSSSGSADVLEALGVRIDLPPEDVGRAIDEIGLGFCFAPVAHGAMKYAAPVRKKLGFRTIFNLLGPLTNPAGARFQLVGANRVAVAEKLAEALARLGTTRALVVCGNDELDEVSLWGSTKVMARRKPDD